MATLDVMTELMTMKRHVRTLLDEREARNKQITDLREVIGDLERAVYDTVPGAKPRHGRAATGR